MAQAILYTGIALVIALAILFAAYKLYRKYASHLLQDRFSIKSITSIGVSARDPQVRAHASTQRDSGGLTSLNTKAGTDTLKSRFIAFGIFSSVVFASLIAKLYSLQILQGQSFERQANENTYTIIKTPAPRGIIYDRNGVALVTNRSSLTVLADAQLISQPDILKKLSLVLGLPLSIIQMRIQDASLQAQSQRVIAFDVDLRIAAYLSEHSSAFPGISVQTRTVRTYPYKSLGAHILGYTGKVTEDDLKNMESSQSLEMGDEVGRTGAEASFEKLLAGDHGMRKLVADADGMVRKLVSETEPAQGNDIYLTIDANVQEVADKALERQITQAQGSAGSLVCLDVETGEIIALANYPTFEPEQFIGGISEERWKKVNSEESRYPLLNRAIAGAYPAGSTFKAFLGLAGIHYGYASNSTTWTCQGTWKGFGEKFPQNCWKLTGHGTLGFKQGIVVSCDVVFYEIAKSFWENRDKLGKDALQNYIKQFGYAKKTGVDLSGEVEGRIPTPEWKAEQFRDAPEQAQWLPGDMSNMAIGQGYVLITPIQLALSYATIAVGKAFEPHIF